MPAQGGWNAALDEAARLWAKERARHRDVNGKSFLAAAEVAVRRSLAEAVARRAIAGLVTDQFAQRDAHPPVRRPRLLAVPSWTVSPELPSTRFWPKALDECWGFLPADMAGHWVYDLRKWDEDDDTESQCLYIGVSSNLAARLRAHQRKWWWSAVDLSASCFHRYESRAVAEFTEAHDLNEYRPLFNVDIPLAPYTDAYLAAYGPEDNEFYSTR